MIKTWNELLKKVVHATPIDLIKNKLDEGLRYLPIKFYEQEQFTKAQICLKICNPSIIIISRFS